MVFNSSLSSQFFYFEPLQPSGFSVGRSECEVKQYKLMRLSNGATSAYPSDTYIQTTSYDVVAGQAKPSFYFNNTD